jgi:hypothetical protein
MNPSDVARLFFGAMEKERWAEAVPLFSEHFVRENASHVRLRLAHLRQFHQSEADLHIPEDDFELFRVWLEKTNFRAEAERQLAEARAEEPDCEFEVVGGVGPIRRFVVGAIEESPQRAIVVYRRGQPDGTPRTLQFRLDENGWRVCSEEFAFEGGPGLGVRRPGRRDI